MLKIYGVINMGYKSINISLDVKQYYQNEEDWKDLVLITGDDISTIGKSGCGLTCGAMLEKNHRRYYTKIII